MPPWKPHFELLMSKLSTSGNTKGAILRDD
jgi:hypothetical protein